MYFLIRNELNMKENNMINNKFTYQEKGELKIFDCICAYCIYNNPNNKKVCSQYKEGKPKELLNSDMLCPKKRINN